MTKENRSKLNVFFFLPIGIGRVIRPISRGCFGVFIMFVATIIINTIFSLIFVQLNLPGFISWIASLFPIYNFIGAIYVVAVDWRDKDIDSGGVLGKSDFSTDGDLIVSGIAKPSAQGIVFGKTKELRVAKPESTEGHVIINGGPGSGKTSGSAIPTLLTWKGTGVVVDIKGELSQKTAHLHDSIILSTINKDSACYNPLDFCHTVEEVQDLGRAMFPEPLKGDPFWSKAAQGIFSAACWELKDECSFSDVAAFLCENSDRFIIETLLGMGNDEQTGEPRKEVKRETRILANVVTSLKAETAAGIFAEIRNKLATFAVDENIQRITSCSDFSPSDVEYKMIYLQLAEHQLKQYGELFNIIITQISRYLAQREEGKKPAVLMLLDEFPRLGKVNGISQNLATLRSRNVHIVIIIQSLAQLDLIYGKDERKVFVDTCKYQLVLDATDSETQEYYSKMAGNQTVKVKSMSQSGEIWRSEQSFTTSEQSVPLIRPEEFGQLIQPILFVKGMKPIRVDKAFWYEDKELKPLVESQTA